MPDLMKLAHEICPHRIGSLVRVNPESEYASEWPGTYIVVAMTWEYHRRDGHNINVAIASEDEIKSRHQYTDGWRPNELLPVNS